jgi:uncharacterized protein
LSISLKKIKNEPVPSIETYRIGLISDTHRVLSPLVFSVFLHVDHIIHAGDIGDWDIVLALQTLAPVTAVYGNCDGFGVRRHCSAQETIEVCGIGIEVIHILTRLPSQEPVAVKKIQIFGHLHIASIDHSGDTLYINPGSASKSRSGDHPTVAMLQFQRRKTPQAQIITLR